MNQAPPIIVINQTAANAYSLPSEQLGACSVNIVCPYCKNKVYTLAKNSCNCGTCLFRYFCSICYCCMWCCSRVCGYCGGGVCNILECLCAFFCCCDADHTCPRCNNIVGHYNSCPHC